MIDDLKKNIEAEISMIKELNKFYDESEKSDVNEKKIYLKIMNSLIKRISLINDSVPEILGDISPVKKLNPEQNKPEMSKIPIRKEVEIKISEIGKDKFLKELNINEQLIKKIKEEQSKKPEKFVELETTNNYGKFSNKLFLSFSQRLIDNGYFKNLRLDVRKSNINILTTTYISMLFFSVMIAFFSGILFTGLLTFFKISLAELSFSIYEDGHLIRLLKLSWLPIAIPLVTGILFYNYPSAEKKAIGNKIDQELPFVVIHMGSISGSGIDPIEIFKIIAMSGEYEFAGQEFRKILNQINIYGYDLSSALRNVSLSTPSQKLSELLNGIGITISSGGDISKFFEKRADTLLLDYRLEREKATKSSETFMDLYISVVIATPMILLMLLVVIAVAKVQTGFNANQLTITIIGVVAIVNILFLSFLHLKQPVY